MSLSAHRLCISVCSPSLCLCLRTVSVSLPHTVSVCLSAHRLCVFICTPSLCLCLHTVSASLSAHRLCVYVCTPSLCLCVHTVSVGRSARLQQYLGFLASVSLSPILFTTPFPHSLSLHAVQAGIIAVPSSVDLRRGSSNRQCRAPLRACVIFARLTSRHWRSISRFVPADWSIIAHYQAGSTCSPNSYFALPLCERCWKRNIRISAGIYI